MMVDSISRSVSFLLTTRVIVETLQLQLILFHFSAENLREAKQSRES